MQSPSSFTDRLTYWLHPRHAVVHLIIVAVVTVLAFTAILLPGKNEASTTSTLDTSALNDVQHEIPPPRTTSELMLYLQPAPDENSIDSATAPETASADSGVSPDTAPWKTISVKSGDTLSEMFQRAGLGTKDIYSLLHSSKQAQALATLKPGQQLAFLIGEDKQLQKLKLVKSPLENIEFVKNPNGYSFQIEQRTPDVTLNFAKITIDSSLFQSASKVGIPDNLAMELASVFGWDVDFVLDIHNGDTFNFVYEERMLDGKKIGNGDIVAAEFNKKGASYQAVRYIDQNGNSRYFTPTGMSMKKEFLRTPVDFAQISSPFNLNRMHPILHKIRAHKGTDYAAPMGTPVHATGNGRVTYAAWKGGYGNTIQIQHGQVYETVYGHLSKYARGIKEGSKVTQGQVIGYVGMTGLATGPHLHYEFHVNGQVKNPVTVKFANSSPIPTSEQPRFLAQTQRYMAQLASYTHTLTPTQIALSE